MKKIKNAPFYIFLFLITPPLTNTGWSEVAIPKPQSFSIFTFIVSLIVLFSKLLLVLGVLVFPILTLASVILSIINTKNKDKVDRELKSKEYSEAIKKRSKIALICLLLGMFLTLLFNTTDCCLH